MKNTAPRRKPAQISGCKAAVLRPRKFQVLRRAPHAWRFEPLGRTVHRLHVDLPRATSEAWILLMSDVHWDNPHCDRALLSAHLAEADARGAAVIDAGDFFCAMQGKWDKRSAKSDIRPEHQKGDYLDSLVTTAADWLRPYAHLLTLRGVGNHESAIKKRHETDLTERLVERLRGMGFSHICAGGMSGFIRLTITTHQTRRTALNYWFHHGYGGGGPVTRGVIQTNRQAVYLADADIVHNGHTHDAWCLPIERIRLNHALVVEKCRQVHVRTAGYKDEYADGHGGWHIERGGPPKPVGSAWVRLYIDRTGKPAFDVTECR